MRSALLISISVYGWFLVFSHEQTAFMPGLTLGIAGIFLVALLPTLLGYSLNRHILVKKRTVWQVLLFNLAAYSFLPGILLLQSRWAGHSGWINLVLPMFWQALSWYLGYFFLCREGEQENEGLLRGGLLEGSLFLMVPFVFLAAFMGINSAWVAALIAIWFLFLLMALAPAASGRENGRINFGLLFIQAAVPALSVVFLSLVVYSNQARDAFRGVMNLLVSLLIFIIDLLTRIFSGRVPEEGESPFAIHFDYREVSEAAGEIPSWFTLFFFILLLAFLGFTLWRFLLWLLGTVETGGRKPKEREKLRLWDILRATLGNIYVLLVLLLKLPLKIVTALVFITTRLGGYVRDKILRILPPRTAGQQISRCYESFLRWGKRKGFPRLADETPLEYAKKWQQLSIPTGKNDIIRFTEIFQDFYYGNKEPGRELGRECLELLRRIRKIDEKKILSNHREN